MIYLDNGATSFPKPKTVTAEVLSILEKVGANAGRSGHRMARQASELVFDARETIADFFHITNPENVGFTYNTTYAINLLLKGILEAGDHVVIGGMEHNSVLRPIKTMAEENIIEYSVAGADELGSVSPEAVARVLKENTKCICISHASNVCGTVSDIQAIGKLAAERGILFMVDAAQSAGVIPISVSDMNIDLLAFPGHKSLMGIQGVGGFYANPKLKMKTIIEGGTGSLSHMEVQPEVMPDRMESGTLNVPGICALKSGIEYINRVGIQEIYYEEMKLVKQIIDGLGNIQGIKLYGREDCTGRVGTVAFTVQGKDCVEVSNYLDSVWDIAVRSGLHCSYLGHKSLGTLESGLVRVSLGAFNTKRDIEIFLRAMNEFA